MRAKIENYSNSVWKGKETGTTEYYGLKSTAAKLGKEFKSTTPHSGSNKQKLKKDKEAEQILAKSLVTEERRRAKLDKDKDDIKSLTLKVFKTIDKRDTYQRKLDEDKKRRDEAERRFQEELHIRSKIGEIRDPEFHNVQKEIVNTYAERDLVNVNLLDKREELRKIKSELDHAVFEKQKSEAEKISNLEKEKGVLLKSKSIKPGFLPLKEDILMGTVNERDLLFNTEKRSQPSTFTMTKWEKEDLYNQCEKYREPESSEEFYNLKYETKDIYGWSSQANCESFLEKVKYDLGDRDYNRLRELFECYTGAVAPLQMGKIESYQFHLFMKDHDLYTDVLDRTQANLKFFAANKSKSISFESFCRILFELALDKYPWEKNRSIALSQFVRHYVFSKKFYEKEKKFEKVLDELYSPEVQDLLNNKKKMELYNRFFDDNSKKRTLSDGTTKDVIDIKQAAKITIDLSIIPDIISKIHFIKLFKLVQKDLDVLDKAHHNDYLEKNEFKELIAAVGIHAYTEDETLKVKFPKSEQKVASVLKLFNC